MPRGLENGKARLTPLKVRDIRKNCLPYVPGRGLRAFARKYDISDMAVRKVFNFVTWIHVT